jgi:hypothetical protein
MRFNKVLVGFAVATVALMVLSGCAGTCGVKSEKVKPAGVTLEYKMDGGMALSYRQTSDMVQTMEVQGQSIPVESVETLEFSVMPGGEDGGLLRLGVTVDDMSIVVSSPQGDLNTEAADVIGKGFDMTLSKLGEESGLPDSETLVYTIESQGDRSLVPMFGVMFPDLPEHPVDIGDTWPALLTMNDDTGGSKVMLTMDAVNTVEGFEKFGGYDCVKISAVLSGIIEASGKQDGVDWSMTSESEGTGTWYFAHKEGIVVSDISEGVANGAITVDAPGGAMEIPVTRTFTMSLELME